MEAWLISVKALPSEKEAAWRRIQEVLATHSSQPLGSVSHFEVPEQFKTGSLDSLLSLGDVVEKLDHHLESLLRRIEREFLELSPASALTVESPNPGVHESLSVDTYLSHFSWNNSKNPVTKSLSGIVGSISELVDKLDEDYRVKTAHFQESKNTLNALSKRETGSLAARDLVDLFASEEVPAESLLNTEYLKTVCVVVPKKEVSQWLRTYEFLCDYVLPKSARELAGGGRDDLTLWTVVILKKNAEHFEEAARQRKWLVRQLKFDASELALHLQGKEQAAKVFEENRGKLERACKILFSELFIALAHIKTIKVFAESVMRYSLPPKFLCAYIRPQPGREKKVLRGLVKSFMHEGENEQMYGLREEAEDGEDFFPFVFVRVSLF